MCQLYKTDERCDLILTRAAVFDNPDPGTIIRNERKTN
jgi:hypothetical protein